MECSVTYANHSPVGLPQLGVCRRVVAVPEVQCTALILLAALGRWMPYAVTTNRSLCMQGGGLAALG